MLLCLPGPADEVRGCPGVHRLTSLPRENGVGFVGGRLKHASQILLGIGQPQDRGRAGTSDERGKRGRPNRPRLVCDRVGRSFSLKVYGRELAQRGDGLFSRGGLEDHVGQGVLAGEVLGDILEGLVNARRHAGDGNEGNAAGKGGEQAVFEGGHAGVVENKASEKLMHGQSLAVGCRVIRYP